MCSSDLFPSHDNEAPEDWYDKTKCAWEPLERRIESYGQMMPGGEIMWLKQKNVGELD